MFPYEEERKVLDEKMQTSEAKKIYKLRKQIVEPVFGDIRENKGIMSFLTRGLERVKTEFNLICAANNIRRMQTKRKDLNQASKSLMKGLDYNMQELNSIHYEKSNFIAVLNCRTA